MERLTAFFRYLLADRKDNIRMLMLIIAFFAFYWTMNAPFIAYMKQNAAMLLAHSPFYGAPFTLNLFNFDPSLYYGYGNATIIHPLLSYLSGPLGDLTKQTTGNALFLTLQSAINAAGVALVYMYMRKKEAGVALSLAVASLFGVSSYSLFTALIPDSYPYAQFFLLVSVVYWQYAVRSGLMSVWPNAALAVVNFGITSTNLIPAAFGMVVALFRSDVKKTLQKIAWIAVCSLLLLAVFTALQNVLPGGHSWIHNWQKSLDNGGYRYTAPFSWTKHWQAAYMLIANPMLTPQLKMIHPGIVAFVTDLKHPFPFYVPMIGFSVAGLALLGFIRGFKTREAWMLSGFIGFAVFLHLVKGFGLALFEYDLYLYAGHYLFALFLLTGTFVASVRGAKTRAALTCVLFLFAAVMLASNIAGHFEALDAIKAFYATVK